jgi:hypothetical protein
VPPFPPPPSSQAETKGPPHLISIHDGGREDGQVERSERPHGVGHSGRRLDLLQRENRGWLLALVLLQGEERGKG